MSIASGRLSRGRTSVSVKQLRHGSTLLERHIEHEGVITAGAEYCVEAGTLEFVPG